MAHDCQAGTEKGDFSGAPIDEGSRGIKTLGGQLSPAAFKLIYESNDGGLCVFEKKDGRVVAVRGSRLV